MKIFKFDGSGSHWGRVFLLGVSLIVAYKLMDNAAVILERFFEVMSLLSPIMIGLIIAYFLYPPSVYMAKKYSRHPFFRDKSYTLGVMTVYVLFITIIIGFFTYLVPVLYSSITNILEQLPNYYANILAALDYLETQNILTVDQKAAILESITIEKLIQFFHLYNIEIYLKGVSGISNVVMSWFMGIVVCAYALLEREQLLGFARRIFAFFLDKEQFAKAGDVFRKLCEIFYSFFSGMALDSLIVGVLGMIGCIILGAPYAVVLGVVVGISNMLPYFGPVVGTVLVGLIVYITDDIITAMWVTVFLIILHQLNGIIIGPKILGDQVGVSPFWVIVAILVGGGMFGIWGMVIGVPLVASIRFFINNR